MDPVPSRQRKSELQLGKELVYRTSLNAKRLSEPGLSSIQNSNKQLQCDRAANASRSPMEFDRTVVFEFLILGFLVSNI